MRLGLIILLTGVLASCGTLTGTVTFDVTTPPIEEVI